MSAKPDPSSKLAIPSSLFISDPLLMLRYMLDLAALGVHALPETRREKYVEDFDYLLTKIQKLGFITSKLEISTMEGARQAIVEINLPLGYRVGPYDHEALDLETLGDRWPGQDDSDFS